MAQADRTEGFSERDFYLQEFRGRTLAVAIPEETAGAVVAIAPALEVLAEGGARAVLLSPEVGALERAYPGRVIQDDHPRLAGEAWRRLRDGPLLAVAFAGSGSFAVRSREVVQRLGIFKLVWLDAGGGLRTGDGVRQSFVHLEQLRRWILDPEAGLATHERLPLWRHVAASLEAGLPAFNVCTAEGLDDELFTYAGSGTLFTRERYVTVRRLGIDDYDAAFDLISRGVAEGYLASRKPAEVDAILASGFGAFVEGRDLAGIGALLPGADGRSGEIASLYTLTRFLGEGVGVSLVGFALSHASSLGYRYVFACTTSERVGQFFERNGFRPVGHEEVPAGKWTGYDPGRRARVRCFRRDLDRSGGELAS